MRPTIYFNEQPCEKAKEILLEYFEEKDIIVDNYNTVVWTGLSNIFANYATVATPCTGTDHVKAKTIIYLDDEFKETVGRNVTSTAEHTLSLMLQLAKKARVQLSGKVLGIIGYGRIGSLVADYCNALGMKILTYDIKGHGNATLDDVLRLSDVISLHIPLEDNKSFINTPEFIKMKNGVLLINTSRQDIINYMALNVQLNNGKVYYADDFIESYDYEHKFEETVVQTPHVGGNSIEAREITDIWLANKLIRYWRSKNP